MMVKHRKSILTVISMLMILCIACGVWLLMPKTATAANGEVITVTDSFASETSSAWDVYESNHVFNSKDVYSTSDSTWGLLVADGWGDPPKNPGGTGYITYKLSPDMLYCFDSVNLAIDAKLSHASGLYWYNSSRMASGVNEVGTNITVYVSDDNASWTPAWNAFDNGGALIKSVGGSVGSSSTAMQEYAVDLSSYVGNGDLYIKVELFNFTVEEINHAQVTALNLNRQGVALFGVEITATQAKQQFDKVISDKFYANESSTDQVTIENSNAYEYSNVDNLLVMTGEGVSEPYRYSELGLLPVASLGESNKTAGNGFVTYKIDADKGYDLSDIYLNFRVGSGHGAGAYWYNSQYQSSGKNTLGANLVVKVSTDNKTWTPVWDLSTDGGCPAKSNERFYGANGQRTPTLDLSSYVEAGEAVYVKFDIMHFTHVETGISSWVTNGIPLFQMGLSLYNVEFAYNQVEVDEVEDNFSIEEDFSKIGLGNHLATEAIEKSNICSGSYGHYAYGVVPAPTWGAYVDATTGYIVYELPLMGNGLFANLSDLTLTLDYYLGTRNSAKFVISASYDNSTYNDVFTIANARDRREIEIDLSEVVEAEDAKSAESLYIKITMIHEEVSVSLGNLSARLHGVKFSAKQNFVMDTGASTRITDTSTGIRFTALINKDIYDTLSSSYENSMVGMFILPRDYIEDYGEINYENIFGENAIYSVNCFEPNKQAIACLQSNVVESQYEGYYAINGAIQDIKAENLTREYVGVAMFAMGNGDKVDYVMFSDFANSDINNTARCATYVAQKAQTDAEESLSNKETLAKAYIDTVAGQKAVYEVRHIYFSSTNNVNNYVLRTYSAEIGSVVTPELNEMSINNVNYVYASSVTIDADTFVSDVNGTVLAGNRLIMYVYYLPEA